MIKKQENPELEIARIVMHEALGTIGDVRPSRSSITALQKSARLRKKDPNFIRNLNIDDWLDSKIGAFLINVKNQDQVNNLLKRVIQLLYRIVFDSTITSIVMLDGHGRTLYFLLEALKISKTLIEPQRYDQLKQNITIIEATDDVQEFHQMTFPNEVSCVKNDVFDYLQNVDFSSTLVYLNFCGLGIPGVKDTVQKTTNNLNSLIDQNPSHLMISYAMRGLYRSPTKKDLTDRLNLEFGERRELERKSLGGMNTWYSWNRYNKTNLERKFGGIKLLELENIANNARKYYRLFMKLSRR